MSGRMDYDRISILYQDMIKTAEKSGRKLELLFHPGMALEEEYSSEMNRSYFEDFNSRENRHIEKNAVMHMKDITG